MKIMVVEDDPHYGEMLTKALSLDGFEVFFAEDGQQAVEMLNNNEIDLVISDVNLPFIDGFELYKVIRSKYPKIDFIMYTSSSDDGLGVLAKRMGISKFVSNSNTSLQIIRAAVLERISLIVNHNSFLTKQILEG